MRFEMRLVLNLMLAAAAVQELDSRTTLPAGSSPPAIPKPIRHVAPTAVRTPTFLVPSEGPPVTPEC